jgi:hypothetical protein
VTHPDDDREVPEPTDDELEIQAGKTLPLEAEAADVLEQAQSVPTDDDEYRSS